MNQSCRRTSRATGRRAIRSGKRQAVSTSLAMVTAVLAIIGAAMTTLAPGAAADTTIAKSVIAGGGHASAGAAHGVVGTIGQIVIGAVSGATHDHAIGFWYVVRADGGTTTAVEKPLANLPRVFRLGQNAPNPFIYRTTIPFDVAAAGPVSLKVYDVQGRMLVALVDEQMEPGTYNVHVNADRLANGVYFYRLKAAETTLVRRFVLTR